MIFLVLKAGLEPARSCPRRILSPVRLPIPPLQQKMKMEAPPRFELGIKVLQTSALPLGYGAIQCQQFLCRLLILKKWSGGRDSNPRPSPWQGDALPLSHPRIW